MLIKWNEPKTIYILKWVILWSKYVIFSLTVFFGKAKNKNKIWKLFLVETNDPNSLEQSGLIWL